MAIRIGPRQIDIWANAYARHFMVFELTARWFPSLPKILSLLLREGGLGG
jgi:hypothetical protein